MCSHATIPHTITNHARRRSAAAVCSAGPGAAALLSSFTQYDPCISRSGHPPSVLFVVHPLFIVVGYVPTLLAAATCVYIGVDFLWDNLVSSALERGVGAAAATYAVFAICLQAGMLWGVLACATAYQLYDRAFGASEKVKSS